MHEAAEYVGVAYKTLAENYHAWGIPVIRIGRRVRFLVRHLDDFIERKTETS